MIILFVLTMYLITVIATNVEKVNMQKGKQKNNFIYHYTGIKDERK